MGMFDKDKEIGAQLTSEFREREQFILYGVSDEGEVELTEQRGPNPPRKTALEVARLDAPEQRFTVSTLSGPISDKAAQAEGSDFPALVAWSQVDTKAGNRATVLNWIGEYRPDRPAAGHSGAGAPLTDKGELPF